MQQPIEARPNPDDLIDSLRTKNYANARYNQPRHTPPSREVDDDTRNQKGIDSSGSRVLQWAVGVVIFLCGVGFGGLISEPDSPTYRTPQAEVEVRTTVVYRLPESCERALSGMAKYLDSAAAVASANDKQLDIFSAAYQAILARDWAALNNLSEEQRKLESTIATDTAKVLPHVATLKKDIEQCTTESS